jgi:hypothetical protein
LKTALICTHFKITKFFPSAFSCYFNVQRNCLSIGTSILIC